MIFFAQILNKVSVALIVNKTLKIARKKKSRYYIQKCRISDQKLLYSIQNTFTANMKISEITDHYRN